MLHLKFIVVPWLMLTLLYCIIISLTDHYSELLYLYNQNSLIDQCYPVERRRKYKNLSTKTRLLYFLHFKNTFYLLQARSCVVWKVEGKKVVVKLVKYQKVEKSKNNRKLFDVAVHNLSPIPPLSRN